MPTLPPMAVALVMARVATRPDAQTLVTVRAIKEAEVAVLVAVTELAARVDFEDDLPPLEDDTDDDDDDDDSNAGLKT